MLLLDGLKIGLTQKIFLTNIGNIDYEGDEMNQELVSVVIAIYNVEQYLRECIESVMIQTYDKLEILLIDDGSTDASLQICQEYEKKDSRIKVYHKENGGLSDARNYGIRNSRGEYICFIDSDDLVSIYYVENMMDMIHKYKVPLVVTNVLKFNDKYKFKVPSQKRNKKNDMIYNSERALEDSFYRKNIPMYACAKLYHRNILEKIQFPKGELYEDISTTYLFIHEAKKIVYNPIQDYFYRQRLGSIVNSEFDKRKMVQVESCKKIICFIEKYYPNIIFAAWSKTFMNSYNIFCSIPNKNEYKKYKQQVKGVINSYKWSVYKDSKNKVLCRLIALGCIVSPEIARKIGRMQQFFISKNVIKQNRPV